MLPNLGSMFVTYAYRLLSCFKREFWLWFFLFISQELVVLLVMCIANSSMLDTDLSQHLSKVIVDDILPLLLVLDLLKQDRWHFITVTASIFVQ